MDEKEEEKNALESCDSPLSKLGQSHLGSRAWTQLWSADSFVICFNSTTVYPQDVRETFSACCDLSLPENENKLGRWWAPYQYCCAVLRGIFQVYSSILFLTNGSSEGRCVSHCYRSDGCYGEPNMHCPPRAVQGCCCCYAASFTPYTASEWSYITVGMRLLSWTSAQNGCSVWKEVCASPSTERVYYYSCDEGIWWIN